MTTKDRIGFVFLATILIWVTINVNLGKNWKEVVEHDIAGYYSHLPAVFIYRDIHFGFFDAIVETYKTGTSKGDFRQTLDSGCTFNKYFCGTAILQAPFFAIAHLVTSLSGNELDGYSYWYVFFMALSSVMYTVLGLWFLIKVLLWFGIKKRSSWLVVLGITFGTNVFVYSSIDPGTSHPYSFACINAFVWYFVQFKESGFKRDFFLLPILLAFIFLIRPINILFVLVLPVFFNSLSGFKDIFLRFS